jgi:hypothetical protein
MLLSEESKIRRLLVARGNDNATRKIQHAL